MTLDRISTLLFVPGNQPARFEKALASGADGIVLDLEDAVSVFEKDTARDAVFNWLRQGAARVRPPGAPLQCLRLNARGWQSFYEPRATLVHHESVSRGFDRDPVGAARLGRELAAMQERWGTDDFTGDGDPFHHPQLSRYSERYALGLRW